MSFNVNDKVKVTANSISFDGMQGVVVLKFEETGGLIVQLENGQQKGFWPNELEPVDAKQEALIRLAETLDSARLQANNINGCEGTIYQQITIPLIGALDALVPVDAVGYDAYEFIIEDGLSVREAIAKVEQ